MSVTIGVLKETARGENRVAVVPEVATRFAALGARLLIERGAGAAARFPDAVYKDAGFADTADAVIAASDLLLAVQPLDPAVAARLKPGSALVGYLASHAQPALVRELKERRMTNFAMELVPRISRAQSMDALSSQSNIAGYRAVIEAAARYGRFLPASHGVAMRNFLKGVMRVSDEQERRGDHVTFKLPGGIQIQASGQIVAMLVTVVICGTGLFWGIYSHEAQSQTFRAEIKTALHTQNKRTDELIFVLALTPDERLEARRGADLSRYCAFLNIPR